MRFNYEQQAHSSPKELFIGDREIDNAYERALEILGNPIDPKTFTDYKDVQADIEFVQKMEERFAEESGRLSPEVKRLQKLAKIFEAIIFQHAEQSNWFGESATTLETSRYDDIVNKVDAIVEFQEGESSASHLAVAMDVTIAEHFGAKFDHVKQGIDEGKLTEVKYFASDFLNIRGRKSKVPHVIIGVDRKTLYDVIDAWMKGDNRRLADHPVQIKILEEIRVQLRAYQKYAEQVGKEDLVPIYQKTESTISAIMREKDITADDLKDTAKDEMFYAIKFNAEHLADRKS